MRAHGLSLKFTLLLQAILLCFSPLSYADLIITNGIIHTMDANQLRAEAIVTRGDKILFVGGLDAAKNMATKNSKILDLKGATLTPGFIEAHGHIMSLGMSKLNLDLNNAKNYYKESIPTIK